jgi:sugar lactone lactonase YvrE
MAMAIGRNGTLYAVGNCNPAAKTFECTPGPAAYNSLYKVNLQTGKSTRIGATGAPQFFMDLAVDRHGTMLGVTTTLNPSLIPAILYRINPATGKATKLFNLVGSNTVMGLALSRDGQLYATDPVQNPGLYRIGTTTGFETAIAALPPSAFQAASN